MLRVLIVGGYGNFGRRIARLLADDSRCGLLLGGRHPARANLAGLGGAQAIRFDRTEPLAGQLTSSGADVVIDASGPFQAYGDNRYALPEAALAAGMHYLDLADDRAFVRDFVVLDSAARAAGRVALTGLSTCPALSGAVLRELQQEFTRIDGMELGIAPSPRARVGRSVIRAMLRLAGRPALILRDGEPQHRANFVDSRPFDIQPPGVAALGKRRFSLVDVPDLDCLPELAPDLRETWFGAAPAPAAWHGVLRGLARLVHWRLLPGLDWLAAPGHLLMSHATWGAHRGGYFLRLRGLDSTGAARTAAWHLVVDGDNGPDIPCLPAVAIVRRLLDGEILQPGARAAHADLTLAELTPLLDRVGAHYGRATA